MDWPGNRWIVEKQKTGVKKSEKSSTVRQFYAICQILKTVEITGLPNVDQKFSQLLVYLLILGLIFLNILSIICCF